MKPWEAVSLILKEMTQMVAPGVRTLDIDIMAEKRIKEIGYHSYTKGYKPEWSKTPWEFVSCIGVNSVIAHGKPGEYILKEGDLVSFDLGICDDEHNCGDAALTVGVGEISNANQRLLYYTKQTLYEAISHIKAGLNTEDLAKIIEYHAMSRGYLVNRRFGGHAIGKEMHMSPKINNTVEDDIKWEELKAGQILCIEPMMTSGKDNLGGTDPNGWTFWTHDGKPSVVFEHMVEVQENGAKILTDHFTYTPGQP